MEQDIKKALRKKREGSIPTSMMLSSGSTLLNLAATGRPNFCFVKGHYYGFIGDSGGGKTWLAIQSLAEAARNENFDNYRLIYDNVENGALMDLEKFFGKKAASRIEPPKGTKADPLFSDRVEDFYDNVHAAIEAEVPFIYILDSMDALSSQDEEDKYQEQRKARQKGKQAAGSYGDGKAKKNSQNMRNICRKIAKSGSILIVICQTRDNIGFGAQFNPKVYSGGRSLLFYATLEIWFSIKERIKKKIREKNRTIGIVSDVRTKKNRITGHDCRIKVPIYRSLGVDDIGSLVDYLIDEGHWKGTANTVKAPEFDYNGSKEKLIRKIEDEDSEKELKNIVKSVWHEIEAASQVTRKKRYE